MLSTDDRIMIKKIVLTEGLANYQLPFPGFSPSRCLDRDSVCVVLCVVDL